MKFNLKIRSLCHRTSLDQHQVVEKLRISVADYSKIETGLLKVEDTMFEAMIAIFRLDRKQFNSWPDGKSKDWVKSYLT